MITTVSRIPLIVHFAILPDPRSERNQIHSLTDLIATAIMATLAGADDYPTISDWVDENLSWLQSLEICVNGTPSHDTYYRLFRLLNPRAFEERFVEWSKETAKRVEGVVAIDGKSINAARDGTTSPLHLVSAFSVENQLVLGSVKAEGGVSGELEGIKALLKVLDVKGMTVTIDAGGCYRVIAEAIRAGGGEYVFTVKNNQHYLLDELENFFLQATVVNPEESGCDYWYSEEKGHGRLERREVWSCGDLGWLPQRDKWPDLASVACMRKTTHDVSTEKTSKTVRFYITSHKPDAQKLAQKIRSHWSIENNLHWQLDVSFNEDRSRSRRDNGGYNLALLRRLCLSLFKKEKTCKLGVKNKRVKAGYSRNYMLKVLGGA
jgi:predicted transposase YbfD/YdcC